MRLEHHVATNPQDPALQAWRSLQDLSAATADALAALGAGQVLPAGRPLALAPGQRVWGPAATLAFATVDALEPGTPVEGIGAGYTRLAGRAAPGDVAVIDADGDIAAAVLGETVAIRLRSAGVAGALVNGALRDGASIRALGFPAWASGRTPVSGAGRFAVRGVGIPVALGEATVEPGDWIVADGDGTCVVPATLVPQVVAYCARMEAE